MENNIKDKGYIIKNNDNIEFIRGFYINKKKKLKSIKGDDLKKNTSYNIYTRLGRRTVLRTSNKVVEIVTIGDWIYVVFADYAGKLSLIKVAKKYKYANNLVDVLTKIVYQPKYRCHMLMLFKSIFVIGTFNVKRNKGLSIVVGTDKKIDNNLKFVFPRLIRKIFNKSGISKLKSLSRVRYTRIKIQDINDHYKITSDINMPAFIKVINYQNGKKYFYQLKHRHSEDYDNENFLYGSRSARIDDKEEMFIRKSMYGQYVVVNTTFLSKRVVLSEKLAYFLAKLSLTKKNKLCFFEKFAKGSSESAFEVFKSFYNDETFDCKRLCYLLDSSSTEYIDLKKEYGRCIVRKNSFRHFYSIFKSEAFVSSELVSHAYRRMYDNDKYIKKVIQNCDKKFFLQHGVCLATNVFARGYYNKQVPIAPDYIMVNSDVEKQLFIDNTDYKADELIKTGLANMDLYVKSEEEKTDVTFLLTWRPWDLVGSVDDDSYIGRYLTFLRLLDENKELKNINVNIVLHPKAKSLLETNNPEIYAEVKPRLYEGDIKDAVLKSKVLITDYSSLCFYAFAGGTNVIYYWEDKEVCEENYGSKNILQADNCFGEICYSMDELMNQLKLSLIKPQSEKYIAKFSKLVETYHGNNTINGREEIKKRI